MRVALCVMIFAAMTGCGKFSGKPASRPQSADEWESFERNHRAATEDAVLSSIGPPDQMIPNDSGSIWWLYRNAAWDKGTTTITVVFVGGRVSQVALPSRSQ